MISQRASTVKQSPYGMSGITCSHNLVVSHHAPPLVRTAHAAADLVPHVIHVSAAGTHFTVEQHVHTCEVSKTSWFDSYMAYRCVW